MSPTGWLRWARESFPLSVEPSPYVSDDREDYWRMLSMVNGWIQHADAKIGVALAFVGAEVASAVALFASSGPLSLSSTVALSSTAVLVLGAVVSGAAGLIPRLSQPGRRRSARRGGNILYFGDIAATYPGVRQARAFARDFQALLSSDDGLKASLASQIQINSGIAYEKFRWANLAVICTFLAGLALMAFGSTVLT